MFADRLRAVKNMGFRNAARLAWRRLAKRRTKCFPSCQELLRGKQCLEIGGPSILFERNNDLPVYPELAELDNCLFAARTVWSGEVHEGREFCFDSGRRSGRQYICEGTDLAPVSAGQYEGVLSCNNLEHIANPLKALKEWTRVLADGGAMIVVVPEKDCTFDHRRPVTAFAHLEDDWRHDAGEDDLSHLEEILRLHDLRRDPAAGGPEAFRERCRRNLEYRCMHHHVFNQKLLVSAMDFAGMQVCAVEALLPPNFVAVARKPGTGESADNRRFLQRSGRN